MKGFEKSKVNRDMVEFYTQQHRNRIREFIKEIKDINNT